MRKLRQPVAQCAKALGDRKGGCCYVVLNDIALLPTKYRMRINEVVITKPQSPQQQRVHSLKQQVERSRQALAAERERQRKERETKRRLSSVV